MPFRSYRTLVEPGKPVMLYEAKAGDVHVEVRAAAFGDDNLSVGFSFRIGGSADMSETGGLVCFDSDWDSDVAEGDEVWIETVQAAFTHATPVTVLVRSVK